MTQTNPSTSSNATPQGKGYWIVFATINEPSRFGNYTSVAGPVIATQGGRVLARGDVALVVEGKVPGRPFLIEFPSYAAAQACFHSADYQHAITLRAGVAQFQIVIVEGFTPPTLTPA
jgi:uncharacterized protein (DUF1330 family)